MTPAIRGATPAAVESALDREEALSGLDGFGGCLDGERVVRDVLGREPVFREADGGGWAFDPRSLRAPESVPAGRIYRLGSGVVTRVLAPPTTTPDEPTTALDGLRTALSSVLETLPDVPVAFSGGIDSGLVATGSTGPLYVVGFPESNDRETATAAAAALDRELRVVELDVRTLESVVPTVAEAIDRTDAMSVSIAVPLYVLGRAVADDGFDRLALGQGADELFAGYEKFVDPADDDRVTADTTVGARDEAVGTIPRQAERDVLALRAAGVEPVCPFLCDSVVEAACRLPESLLVADGTRKVGLRRVARHRLPASIADRRKRAVQYGTLTARELDRLAREAGFERRLGDHVSKYIADRVDGARTRGER